MSQLTLRLESYAREARELIGAAQTLADERQHAEVEPLHLLFLLLEQAEGAADAVERAGVDPHDVLVEAELLLRRMRSSRDGKSYLSPRLLDLLGRAEGEAARQGGVPVDPKHLMLACAQETAGGVKEVFRRTGLSAPILRATLAGASIGGGETSSGSSRNKEDIGDPIEEFGRDLTRLAAQGKFDPTVGRDAELRRVLQVLARRRENNPLLIGESGIGKSAIVQALAQRIAVGDVPKFLEGKRIVALEMGNLVAGASLRGQLEERIRKVLTAVRDAAGQIILYLPDIGALSGQKGAGAGSLVAAAMNRGELRAIAVATPDAVRKAFDDDNELTRRFVGIPVEPPTTDEALAVLRGIVDRFEIDHGVRIADPALVSAVSFAKRYVPEGQLPKSAIDLIDEAAARVRVEMESEPAELDHIRRRLEAIEIQAKSLENDSDDASVHAREKLVAEGEELRPRLEALEKRWKAELAGVGDVRRLKEELGAAQRELE